MRAFIAVLAVLIALSPALATDGHTTSENPEQTSVQEEPPAATVEQSGHPDRKGEQPGRPDWESEVDPGEPCDDYN